MTNTSIPSQEPVTYSIQLISPSHADEIKSNLEKIIGVISAEIVQYNHLPKNQIDVISTVDAFEELWSVKLDDKGGLYYEMAGNPIIPQNYSAKVKSVTISRDYIQN